MQHVRVVAEGLYACFGCGVLAALHGLVQASFRLPYAVAAEVDAFWVCGDVCSAAGASLWSMGMSVADLSNPIICYMGVVCLAGCVHAAPG